MLLIGTTACTAPTATRIDPAGTQTITTISGLNIQDALDAASDLSQSLLNSGILGRNGSPSKIAISNYRNNTSIQIDRDRIIKKIRVTLNKAGVAQTFTTFNSSGGTTNTEDGFATRHQPQTKLTPDYTLTLKILEDNIHAGRTRQVTYTFQMSLTDIKNGLAVWEDEKMITKQGKKPAIGW